MEPAQTARGPVDAETHPAASSGEIAGIEVPGGTVYVEQFRSGTEPVLAIHGISSQRRLWNWLRAAAPGLSLVAPDLRGRGDSVGAEGPSSIARHAADMVAVLDRLGLPAVHVCGMSMGGFVAVELATAYPGRVKSLILVDGGFPQAGPPGLTPRRCPRSSATGWPGLSATGHRSAITRSSSPRAPRLCSTRPTRSCWITSPMTWSITGSGSAPKPWSPTPPTSSSGRRNGSGSAPPPGSSPPRGAGEGAAGRKVGG